jgi:hypothetical protein
MGVCLQFRTQRERQLHQFLGFKAVRAKPGWLEWIAQSILSLCTQTGSAIV